MFSTRQCRVDILPAYNSTALFTLNCSLPKLLRLCAQPRRFAYMMAANISPIHRVIYWLFKTKQELNWADAKANASRRPSNILRCNRLNQQLMLIIHTCKSDTSDKLKQYFTWVTTISNKGKQLTKSRVREVKNKGIKGEAYFIQRYELWEYKNTRRTIKQVWRYVH